MVRTGLFAVGLLLLATSAMTADPKSVQGSATVKGSFWVNKAKFQPKHVAVFETNPDLRGIDRICIAVSNEPLKTDKIEWLLEEDEYDSRSIRGNYVVVSFTRKGKPVGYNGGADNDGFCGGLEQGTLTIVNNRICGSAKTRNNLNLIAAFLNPDLNYGFDFQFDIPVPDGMDVSQIPVGSDVTGRQFIQQVAQEEPSLRPAGLSDPLCGYSESSQQPGSFVIIGTAQGTIRTNTRTGESCLLVIAPDGKLAQWESIHEPSISPPVTPKVSHPKFNVIIQEPNPSR